MNSPHPVAAGPIDASARHESLDTLRGVAVLGILVMNIYAFAMPFPAYMNPLLMGGTEWYNLGTWFLTHVLADQKFMSIFSMLFGAGTVLMWERAVARGAAFGRIYYRRLFWLLVIGAAHGYLLWVGDILFHYALVGMLVYPARKWRPRTLIIVACLLLPVAPLLSFAGHGYLSQLSERVTSIRAAEARGATVTPEQQADLDEWRPIAVFISPSAEDIREDLDAHRGSYRDVFEFRRPAVLSMHTETSWFFMIWRVGGMMMLGMALMKLGILSGTRDPGLYRRMLLLGYGLGLPLMLYSSVDLYAHNFDGLYHMQRGSLPNYVGSILVAFGHIGLVMRLLQRNLLKKLLQRFAAVGRMAFSNYLMHSLVMTSIFYGYGLGLYGHIPRAAQMLFVAGMLLLQLALSPWWLARYRFGPAEWIWRTLTYWQRQPMRRRRGAARRTPS